MRGMERFIAILLLVGGLAGAAAFARHAGAPPETSFAAPFVQPSSHGASGEVLTVAPFPVAHAARRPAPVSAGPTVRLAAPVRRFVPAPVVHVVQPAVSAHPARPAAEPAAPVKPPTPTPNPAPTPAPAPAPPAPAAPATPTPTVPVAPPVVVVTTTAHDNGNGKDRGKAKGRDKGEVQVTPVADTATPVAPVTTDTTTTTPELAPAPPVDDQHDRGHDNDK